MRNAAPLIVFASLLVFANVGCGKKDETADPNTAQNALQPGQPGYVAPQPGQPGYVTPQPGYVALQPGQPGYVAPQPGQPGYVAPQPGQPGYVAPAPQGMAVPGPQALACQSDAQCMTHRCNTQYGKCAFPCASDVDCNPGAYCFRGPVPACLPKAPGQP
jgi:hypothetical protein